MKTLKQLLAGMALFFQNLFNNLPGWVERAAPQIFEITKSLRALLQNAETALESDIADLFVQVFPGTMDNELRDRMIILLQKAIPVVVTLEDCNGDIGCMIRQFLKVLAGETEKGAKGKLMSVASVMLAEHDGRKLKENRYDSLMQLAYSKMVA